MKLVTGVNLNTVSISDCHDLSNLTLPVLLFMRLENTELPARDLRILELLAMKHEKLFAEEQRSQMAHRSWLLQRERDQKVGFLP